MIVDIISEPMADTHRQLLARCREYSSTAILVLRDPEDLSPRASVNRLQPSCLSKEKRSESMTWNGEFARKRVGSGDDADAKRAALLLEFAQLYRLTGLAHSAFAVNVHGLAEEKQALRKRELFQHVVTQALQRLDTKYGRVALLCDTEQDAADHFRKWLDNLQHRDEESRPVVLLGFARSEAFYPLQCADLLAYLVREELERGTCWPERPVDPLLWQFGDPHGVEHEYIVKGKKTDALGNPL